MAAWTSSVRSFADVVRGHQKQEREKCGDGWLVATVSNVLVEKQIGYLRLDPRDPEQADSAKELTAFCRLHSSDSVPDVFFHLGQCSFAAGPILLRAGDVARFQLDKKSVDAIANGNMSSSRTAAEIIAGPGGLNSGGKGDEGSTKRPTVKAKRVEAVRYSMVAPAGGKNAWPAKKGLKGKGGNRAGLPDFRGIGALEKMISAHASGMWDAGADHDERSSNLDASKSRAFFEARACFWELCFRELVHNDKKHLLRSAISFLFGTLDAHAIYLAELGDSGLEVLSSSKGDIGSLGSGRTLRRAPPLDIFVKELFAWVQDSLSDVSDSERHSNQARDLSGNRIAMLFDPSFFPMDFSNADVSIESVKLFDRLCRYMMRDMDRADPAAVYRHLLIVSPLVRKMRDEHEVFVAQLSEGDANAQHDASSVSRSIFYRLQEEVVQTTERKLLESMLRSGAHDLTTDDRAFHSIMASRLRPERSDADGFGAHALDQRYAHSINQSVSQTRLLAPTKPRTEEFAVSKTIPIVHKMLREFRTWEQYWQAVFFLARENCFAGLKHDVKLFSLNRKPEHDVRFYLIRNAGYHTAVETGPDMNPFATKIGDLFLMLQPELIRNGHSRLERNDRWKRMALRFGTVCALTVSGKLDCDILWLRVHWSNLEGKGGSWIACEMLEMDGHVGMAPEHRGMALAPSSGRNGTAELSSGMNGSGSNGPAQASTLEKVKRVWGNLHCKKEWLLVESPTFFPAHGPVLAGLANRFRVSTDVGGFSEAIVYSDFKFNHSDFCGQHHLTLADDLVSNCAQKPKPDSVEPFYLKPHFTIPRETVFKRTDDNIVKKGWDLGPRMALREMVSAMEDLLVNFTENRGDSDARNTDEKQIAQDTIFNYEQLRAVQHALSHKIVVIQGAPGTGKSYLGVRLARILSQIRDEDAKQRADKACAAAQKEADALSKQGKGPKKAAALRADLEQTFSRNAGGVRILMLAEKNHALDEYIKDCLENGMFESHDVIRVGGGSEEPLLKERNWSTLKAQIMRNLAKGGGKGGPVSDAQRLLFSTRDELKLTNTQRDEALAHLLASGVFTPCLLLGPLTMPQLKMFLIPIMEQLEQEWGSFEKTRTSRILDRPIVRALKLPEMLQYVYDRKRITLRAHIERCFDVLRKDVSRGTSRAHALKRDELATGAATEAAVAAEALGQFPGQSVAAAQTGLGTGSFAAVPGVRGPPQQNGNTEQRERSANVNLIDPDVLRADVFLFDRSEVGESEKCQNDLLNIALYAVFEWISKVEAETKILSDHARDGSINAQADRFAGDAAYLRSQGRDFAHCRDGSLNTDESAIHESAMQPDEEERPDKKNECELEDEEELEARRELEELAAGGTTDSRGTQGGSTQGGKGSGKKGQSSDQWRREEDVRIKNGIRFFTDGTRNSQEPWSFVWLAIQQPIVDSIDERTKRVYRNFAETMLSLGQRERNDGRYGSANSLAHGSVSAKGAKHGAFSRSSSSSKYAATLQSDGGKLTSKGPSSMTASYSKGPSMPASSDSKSNNGISSPNADYEGLWGFSDRNRALLVQVLIEARVRRAEQKLIELESRRERLRVDLRRAVNDILGTHLRQHKILGMTISGACIHSDLVKEFRPHVVMVEEAGEIGEPQLVACLGPWVKHLILIGDHWQLPPQVEWHPLKLRHGLGRSLMERMIDAGLPFSKLRLQSRMHPELSRNLLFKYTDLIDNLARVQDKESAKIVGVRDGIADGSGVLSGGRFSEKRFFWFDMAAQEDKSQSFTNRAEALFCVKLALSLILSGVPSKDITILAPYLGQASLFKRAQRGQLNDYLSARSWGLDYAELLKDVRISSVDRYQGDENQFVIVSMTRSNDEGKCGFLKTPEGLNRLIVILSRARGGLFLVGDATCFSKEKGKQWRVWKDKISQWKEERACADSVCLQCPRHAETWKMIRGDADFDTSASREFPLCEVVCGKALTKCGHNCKQNCHGGDCNQALCKEEVMFPCSKNPAGHPNLVRRCNQRQSDIKCMESVGFSCAREGSSATGPLCGATLTKKCWQEDEDIVCSNAIEYPCDNCGNQLRRFCYEKRSAVVNRCAHEVSFVCKDCQGKRTKLCSQKESQAPPCGHPCARRIADCSEHPCPRLCGQKCPPRCEEAVHFECVPVSKKRSSEHLGDPLNEPHPLKRKCFQKPTDIQCQVQLSFQCPRGLHEIYRFCFQAPDSVVCPKRCEQKLACGHACPLKCGEECPTAVEACTHKTPFGCWNCDAPVERSTCWQPEVRAIEETCRGSHKQTCSRGHDSQVPCMQMFKHMIKDCEAEAELLNLAPSLESKHRLRETGRAIAAAKVFCQHFTKVSCSNCASGMREKKCHLVTGNELCEGVCQKKLGCEFKHLCGQKCSDLKSAEGKHDCTLALNPSPENPSLIWCPLCKEQGTFRALYTDSFQKQELQIAEPWFKERAAKFAQEALNILDDFTAAVGKSRGAFDKASRDKKARLDAGVQVELMLGQIEYSQLSVSDTFSNGSTIRDVREDLVRSRANIKDFGELQVVAYYFPGRNSLNPLQNLHLISLDNRRLCTFRLAFSVEKPIVVRLWKSPQAYKEATRYDGFGEKYEGRLERGARGCFIDIKLAPWALGGIGDKKLLAKLSADQLAELSADQRRKHSANRTGFSAKGGPVSGWPQADTSGNCKGGRLRHRK